MENAVRLESIHDVLKGNLDKAICKNFFNSTVVSAMLYASEVWVTTKREEQWLIMAQRAMKRLILGVSLEGLHLKQADQGKN